MLSPRMRAVVAIGVLGLGGCGRLGFEPQPASDDGDVIETIDAATPQSDANVSVDGSGACAEVCDDCQGGVCIVEEPLDFFVCPAGATCEIFCDDPAECPGLIDCSQARSCAIHCSGTESCGGDIECAGTDCVIECGGTDSCTGAVDCQGALCSLVCDGIGSCAAVVTCDDGGCYMQCSGANSCASGVDCENACSCGVQCSLDAACPSVTAPVICPPGCGTGNGCETDTPECPTCG